MSKLANSTTWVALVAICGAIATSSDPGMPTSVKTAAVIGAAVLNALHIGASHLSAAHRDTMAVAAKSLAVQAKALDAGLALPAQNVRIVDDARPRPPAIINTNPTP